MYRQSVELLKLHCRNQRHAGGRLVLVAGDLTKDSELYNHDRARELFSRFRKPVYCVSGNHDQPRSAPASSLLPRSGGGPVGHRHSRLYGDFDSSTPAAPRTAVTLHPTSISSASVRPSRSRLWMDRS
jgi:DNA repair exonuclease SbcCD nuclease subunit